MSLTLKLRRNASDLSYQGGSSGLQLLDDGYFPRVAPVLPGRLPPPLVETFRLRSLGTSHDNLATYLQSLATYQYNAAEYLQWPENPFPVWLYAQMLNETTQRRAAVRSIDWDFTSSWFSGAPSAGNRQALAVAIERMGLWEAVSTANFATQSPSAQVSVVYDPTSSNDINGDAPGRMSLSLTNTTASVTLDRAWIGIRSANKWGNSANLQHIWECEIGTLGTDAALATDATASDIYASGSNQKVTVTPGTATWAKRLTIRMDSVVNIVTYPDLRHQFGMFVWLLRSKVSAGTWEIKLTFGYDGMADADFIEHDPFEVSNTSWDFYKGATQSIPIRDGHVAMSFSVSAAQELYNTVQVWARRTDGSGTLDIDCLVEIPIDEGFLFITENMDIDQNEAATFVESPLGKVGVGSVGSSRIKAFPPFDYALFRPPPGDIRMYVAYARASSTDITDTAQLSGSYYASYRSLAGAG